MKPYAAVVLAENVSVFDVVGLFDVVGTGSDDDEYYEVDDLEEMHTAIVNNDYEQVSVWLQYAYAVTYL